MNSRSAIGSSDNSGELTERVADQHPGRFRYFYIKLTGGPSAPRNVGIPNAQGRVVIILDDGVIPDRIWSKATGSVTCAIPSARLRRLARSMCQTT